MRTLEFTADGETYHVGIRQGLAMIHDSRDRLVRVHRIDGGRLCPSPNDKLMAELIATIKATEGGTEYLDACANVRIARDMALADPASKWREYEAAWLEAREIRESWEDGRGVIAPASRTRASGPHGIQGAKLPRASVRRRLVAWGQR